MAKIDLNEVKSGFNLSKINENFQKIKDVLNGKILWRDNPTGEPNHMMSDLDMNGKRIYNLPEPVADHEPARKSDVDAIYATTGSKKVLRVGDVNIPELPDANIRRNKLFSFDNLGNPQVQFPSSDSATQLRIDLSQDSGYTLVGGIVDRLESYDDLRTYTKNVDTVDIIGEGIAGRFKLVSSGSDNGGTLIVGNDGRKWKRLFTDYVSGRWFGAIGDGVNDDTDAIQRTINSYTHIDISGRNWKITKKLSIPSNRFIDLRGANLTANTGSDPIFEFETAGDGLYILHGAGVITGTASAFLKCSGSTYAPTSVSQYARQIRLEGLHISSETIENFLDFQGAVRQVFMHKVQAYTKNGINANGKCVEVKGHACVIYGSTSSLSTYGIKLRGPGGGSAYPEGFHFTDCTIDAFWNTFDVNDIYVMSVTAGHVGCVSGGRVALFGYPTTTACRNIKFTGVNISGPIEFLPTGGLAYQAQFTGCVSENCDGNNFTIRNNAASIDISDHKFHTSTNGVAVACYNNNADVNVRNITCDSTFIGGVLMMGSAGANCSIRGVSYAGTGNSIYLARPVLVSGVPVTSPTVLSYLQTFNANSIQGSYATSAEISSVYTWFPKGETGEIVCELSFNGASSSSQILEVVLPTGLSVATGTGWNSQYIQPNMSNGRISVRIPYLATTDIVNKPITLKNSAGNVINIDYHSHFGIYRDH